MRLRSATLALVLAASWVLPAKAQNPENSPFRAERLSERVLLLTEISPMENIIVALATEKGLVVVDATGSPLTAGVLREAIEAEFGRDDLAFVVQTHYHWDHAWGNGAFPEAAVVAHEAAQDLVRRDRSRVEEIRSNRRENLQEMEARLAAAGLTPEETVDLRERRDFQERIVRGMGCSGPGP